MQNRDFMVMLGALAFVGIVAILIWKSVKKSPPQENETPIEEQFIENAQHHSPRNARATPRAQQFDETPLEDEFIQDEEETPIDEQPKPMGGYNEQSGYALMGKIN